MSVNSPERASGARKVKNGINVPQVGPLNQVNVQRLTELLQGDQELREAAIAQIEESVHAFVEGAFQLNPLQRRTLRRLLREEEAEKLGRAYASLLEHGGNVEYQETYVNGEPVRAPKQLHVRIDSSAKESCDEETRSILRIITTKI